MGCDANKTDGAFHDCWIVQYDNQFNKSFEILDSNGVAIPMGHITNIAVELYLTKDFSVTPFALMTGNWQNEDAETGVLEVIMEKADVNALVPGKDWAFAQVVLTDASAGDVDYVKADVLFKNFPTAAVN